MDANPCIFFSYEKNVEGKKVHNPPKPTQNGHVKPKEEPPAARQQADVFMEMGGKGDPQLFENDRGSRYETDEVPR